MSAPVAARRSNASIASSIAAPATRSGDDPAGPGTDAPDSDRAREPDEALHEVADAVREVTVRRLDEARPR